MQCCGFSIFEEGYVGSFIDFDVLGEVDVEGVLHVGSFAFDYEIPLFEP